MTYTYHLTSSSCILRSDGAFIPNDPNNADYQKYLAWLAVPNTPAPYVPAVVSLSSLAQAALTESDITILRCYSANVAVPSSWQTYRNALRAIVNGTDITSTTLPAAPSYPVGT